MSADLELIIAGINLKEFELERQQTAEQKSQCARNMRQSVSGVPGSLCAFSDQK